ncbi:MAG: ABC transporter ATP-binding protein/permease [Ruminococcus sp.]|nr:ABC transporter ATP-binding protein/permease [Ruminococcus sp.]
MKNENYLKWLLRYSKKSKKDLILYCITGLLMVGVWIAIPIYMSKLTLNLTSGSWKDLYYISFFIFGLHFFFNILKVLISNFALKFITETYRNLHLDISSKFMNTEISSINKKSSGYYINRLTDDTVDVSDFFIRITDDIIDILINIGSLLTVFVLNKYIFCFYLYFLILLFLIKKAKTNHRIKYEKAKKESVENLMTTNIEMIRGIEEIKVLNIKEKFLKLINKKIKKFSTSLIKLDNVERFYQFIYNSTINIFRFFIVGLCIFLISKDKLTISIALIAINYEDNIFNLLNYTESIIHNIKKFKLCANRIMEITSYQESSPEIYGKKKIENKEVSCNITNLTFSYNNKNKTLSNINLDIKPKESVAIVGKSGTGKTSILRLINKLYLPNKGNITLNDIDLNDLSESSLRNSISVVTQHPYLFHMSIRENLKIVNDNITDEDIIKACTIAQIHHDILKMPNKYDTIIEENGKNLSGGQKQRLAIARVILRNTPIILFDEATSSLDNETEQKISLALSKMQGKYTMITVAHRLSTIINNDKIYFLKDKKIIASGTHKELLKSCPEYQDLYKNGN